MRAADLVRREGVSGGMAQHEMHRADQEDAFVKERIAFIQEHLGKAQLHLLHDDDRPGLILLRIPLLQEKRVLYEPPGPYVVQAISNWLRFIGWHHVEFLHPGEYAYYFEVGLMRRPVVAVLPDGDEVEVEYRAQEERQTTAQRVALEGVWRFNETAAEYIPPARIALVRVS